MLNYNQLLAREVNIANSKSKVVDYHRQLNQYRANTPTKGIGKSRRGLTHIPDDIKNMSVWDD